MAPGLTRLSEEKDMVAPLALITLAAPLVGLASLATLGPAKYRSGHSIAEKWFFGNGNTFTKDRELGCALAAKDTPKSIAA